LPFPCYMPFALCVVVLPLSPFLPRSSTAGRYDANNFPSGLCRITLNLFFLLLSTSLDQSPLCCNVSCRVVSCLWFRGLSCPSSFLVYYALRCYGSFLSSSLTVSATKLLPLPSSHHPSITNDYDYYFMLFSFYFPL
jgi:hypothetical protein